MSTDCLDDWTWCDVDLEGSARWIYADYLYFDYQSRVPILTYGPQLGLAIVFVTLGDYWGRYYSRRPWYAQRNVLAASSDSAAPGHQAAAPTAAAPTAAAAPASTTTASPAGRHLDRSRRDR